MDYLLCEVALLQRAAWLFPIDSAVVITSDSVIGQTWVLFPLGTAFEVCVQRRLKAWVN